MLMFFSVGPSARQESSGSANMDGWHAVVDECNAGVGSRTASFCYQHSGPCPFSCELTALFAVDALTLMFGRQEDILMDRAVSFSRPKIHSPVLKKMPYSWRLHSCSYSSTSELNLSF